MTEPAKASVHSPNPVSVWLPPVHLVRLPPPAAWLAGFAALAFAGCAQQPVSHQRASHSKEYFPGSIYGKPSPRVVAYGEPVPRGGGFYMVGKPYSVAGQMFFPTEKPRTTIGLASWYGEAFHGRRTANGEIYDCDAITAAHPTMPLPSYARVTNLENRHSLIVRVNDRGPFHENRVMDVSRRTAEILNINGAGTARVKVEYIGPASLEGSDDEKLLASLRTNGPAILEDRDRPSDIELASSRPTNSPAVALASAQPLERTDLPMPPIRAAVADHRLESEGRKAVANAIDAPLPPVRPDSVKIRTPTLGFKATQVAKASSDKSLSGH